MRTKAKRILSGIRIIFLGASVSLLTLFFSCGGNDDPGPNPNTSQLNRWSETIQYKFTFGRNNPVSALRSYSTAYDINIYGTGQAAGTQYNDAFYIRNNPPEQYESMLFIDDNPAIPASDQAAYPVFSGSSIYNFQRSVQGTPQFSIGDTNIGDNTGYYVIHIYNDDRSSISQGYTPCGAANLDLGTPITQLNSVSCGPSSLSMYLTYRGIDNTEAGIQDDLTSFEVLNENGETEVEKRFWLEAEYANTSSLPYQDGYVRENELIFGTYGEYLVDVAASYMPNDGDYFVRAAQYMELNDLKYFLDHNTPVFVTVYANRDGLGYDADNGFTHFVLVTGYDDTTEEFTIYDPYTYNGRVTEQVRTIGYNDFYNAWNGPAGGVPPDNQRRWGLMIVEYENQDS